MSQFKSGDCYYTNVNSRRRRKVNFVFFYLKFEVAKRTKIAVYVVIAQVNSIYLLKMFFSLENLKEAGSNDHTYMRRHVFTKK